MHIKRGGCGTENVSIVDVRSCVRNENSNQYFKDTLSHEADRYTTIIITQFYHTTIKANLFRAVQNGGFPDSV